MTRTTRKLSGHAKDRFLVRFFQSEPSLDAVTAARLAARGQATFTSFRVRRDALARHTQNGTRNDTRDGPLVPVPATNPADTAQAGRSPAPETPAEPRSPPDTSRPPDTSKPAATVEPADTTSPLPQFDPYSIGLVPVFQREGRDGLIARLATIASSDQLRQMAKVQKIVLPQDVRTGDQEADAVRTAIADAVARRIADRRAAAG